MVETSKIKKVMSHPNFLTLFRIAAVPAIVILMIFPNRLSTFLAAALFGAAAITDALTRRRLEWTKGSVSKDYVERNRPPFTEAELIGSWKANRGDAQFGLTLGKDGQFTWDYASGKDKQAIKGVFIVDDGVLAMEPDSGGVMLADVSKPAGGKFTFRQNGTAGEPLEFQKL